MIEPLDKTPYKQHRASCLASAELSDGMYVYVQDGCDQVWVVPDGAHRHPKVLGGARAVKYAGDLSIQAGKVKDLTNLSGTFRCDDPSGLLAVAEKLREVGLDVLPGAIRFFPPDGIQRPSVIG